MMVTWEKYLRMMYKLMGDLVKPYEIEQAENNLADIFVNYSYIVRHCHEQ